MPRIACPSCGSRYDLAAAALGPAGKKVRCARCGHVWLASAEADPPPPPQWPEPPGPRVRDPGEDDPVPPPAALPPEIAPSARPPGPPAPPPEIPVFNAAQAAAALDRPGRGGIALLTAWALSIGVVGALAFAGMRYREAVIEAWPASARLYALLGLGG